MNRTEYQAIIYAGSEDRNREYKESFPWQDTHGKTKAKVVKGILAMSNLRDGGHIIIGVKEESGPSSRYTPLGVREDHLATFSDEAMADFVRNYADPYATFNLDVVFLNGMNFVVIAVRGFEESPVICKKDYGNILSNGRVYVRSRSGRPRSEPVTHYPDMRELLDLAVERGVRRFLERQARVGAIGPTDSEQFEQQLVDFS